MNNPKILKSELEAHKKVSYYGSFYHIAIKAINGELNMSA